MFLNCVSIEFARSEFLLGFFPLVLTRLTFIWTNKDWKCARFYFERYVINSWDHDEDCTPMMKLDKVTLLFSNRRDSFQPKTLYARIQCDCSGNSSRTKIQRINRATKGRRKAHWMLSIQRPLNTKNVTNSCAWKSFAKNTP